MRLSFTKFMTLLSACMLLACLWACSKKGTPQPAIAIKPTITNGSYKITVYQTSANGDTNYFTHDIDTDRCVKSIRYTFNHGTVTQSGDCGPTATATYSYDPDKGILTLSSNGATGTIKIENLTSTGFIWDAIATSQDDARLQLELVPN